MHYSYYCYLLNLMATYGESIIYLTWTSPSWTSIQTSTFPFQVFKKILFTLTYYIHLDSRSDQSENTLNLHSGIIMRRSGGENRLALHLSSFVWRKDGSFVNATSATMTLHQVFLLFCGVYFLRFYPVSGFIRR